MYNNIVNRDTGTTKARDSEMKDCGTNERRHERALTFAKKVGASDIKLAQAWIARTLSKQRISAPYP